MSFGLSSPVDLLSWAVAALLVVKITATAILLVQGRQARLVGRRNVALWWAGKVVPLVAAPGLLAIAWLQGRSGEIVAYGALAIFVWIAAPLLMWRRQRAVQISASAASSRTISVGSRASPSPFASKSSGVSLPTR